MRRLGEVECEGRQGHAVTLPDPLGQTFTIFLPTLSSVLCLYLTHTTRKQNLWVKKHKLYVLKCYSVLAATSHQRLLVSSYERFTRAQPRLVLYRGVRQADENTEFKVATEYTHTDTSVALRKEYIYTGDMSSLVIIAVLPVGVLKGESRQAISSSKPSKEHTPTTPTKQL